MTGKAQHDTSAGGSWQRKAHSGPLVQLARDWERRVPCPTCQASEGRACRTTGGYPTNEHRGRRDAAGTPPYEEWRKQGLWARATPLERPPLLQAAHTARTAYRVDTSLADSIAVVKAFLSERLGIALKDDATLDRLDAAVQELVEARGPAATADLVTVLASYVVSFTALMAGPGGDLDEFFDTYIRTQLDTARRARP
ncbi:hypothetical protein PL81_27010 [Streptomyces sp. RSD-27]|nr:hypothetical protein PL81_27010 [Streptomyces sp. RSD-27]